MQQGEELCRVSYELFEFVHAPDPAAPSQELEGGLNFLGGVPLNVGLPDLVLELADGRRVALEITAVRPNERNETYGARGRVLNPGYVSRAQT